jgi:FtsX-like permease family
MTASWLRIELRRRWRSLAVLALLIAIATGTVLAAVAGARRGATAAQRLWDRTAPATAAVLPNDPRFDWSTVRALPEVESMTTFAIAALYVDELPGYSEALVTADRAGMHDLERPVVLAGRLADPSRIDEVVITPRFPGTYRKRVGDTVTLHLMSPAQAEDPAALGAGKPAGPRVPARIVGMVRSPWYSDEADSGGHLISSPALYQRYPANFLGSRPGLGFVNAIVRLHGGEATLPAFKDDLARVTGRGDIDVWNNAELLRGQQKGDRFEAACLLAFGLAALVAAVLLVGQALARCVAAGAADLRVLAALGMRRRQGVVAAVAAPVLAGLSGTAVGLAVAVVASWWLPIGTASLTEPAPGIAADWLVLGAGAAVAVLAVAAGAVGAAWLALAGAGRAAARRSAVAVAAARVGAPVPVVVGTRFALEPGRGHTAVPVRSALLGAVVGVLGVLAATTFSAGVSDAAATPARFGQTFQLTAFLGEGGHDWAPPTPLVSALRGDPDVVAVDDARIAVAQAGGTSISMYTYAPVGGDSVPVVLRSGRLPAGPGEVVLAPASAKAAGMTLGSTVELRGTRSVTATVVGLGFMPEGGHNTYSDGGWVTPAGYDRLFDGFKYHRALVALRAGTDPNAVLSRLRAGGAALPVEVTPPPTQVTVIRDVRRLPAALGVFLGILALGAVGHALATAVRRRRVEVAVLQALGMTRWQCRGVVVTQASVLALAGLAFGVPLGLALGRALWRVVADFTPLQYVPPAALWALALVGPLALAAANLLAAWPGRQAARLRIGDVLRAE